MNINEKMATVDSLIQKLLYSENCNKHEIIDQLTNMGHRMVAISFLNGINGYSSGEIIEQYDKDGFHIYDPHIIEIIQDIDDPRLVHLLIQRLDDPDHTIQAESSFALGYFTDPIATDALIALIEREKYPKNIAVVCNAIEALYHIGDERSIPAIIDLFDCSSSFVQNTAIIAMIKFGERALMPLITAMNDPRKNVSYNACTSICNLGIPVLENMREILKKTSDNATARGFAAQIIGLIGDKNDIEFLLQFINEDDDFTRRSVLRTLGTIGDASAYDPLIKILKSDNDITTRKIVVWSLGKIGDPRAIDSLLEAIKPENASIRDNLAKSLGSFGEMSYPKLKPMLDSADPLCRYVATEALGFYGNKESITPLLKKLTDKDPEIRSVACLSLGLLKEKTAVEPLITLLKNDYKIRRSVIKALGDIRDEKAESALIELFERNIVDFYQTYGILEDGDCYYYKPSNDVTLEYYEEDIEIVILLIRALGSVGGDDSYDSLRANICGDYPQIYDEIMEAIGKLEAKCQK